MMTGLYYSHNLNKARHDRYGVATSVAAAGRYCKTKFTGDEDAMLSHLVSVFGTDAWKKISRLMGTRNPRQCRERYNNYLNPNLNQSSWMPDEDELLMAQFEEHGPKWNTIAKSFTNRSDMSLRNRWHQLDRRMKRTGTLQDDSESGTPFCAATPDVSDIAPPLDISPVAITHDSTLGTFDVFDPDLHIFEDQFDVWNCFY
jgi:hypothetical protein